MNARMLSGASVLMLVGCAPVQLRPGGEQVEFHYAYLATQTGPSLDDLERITTVTSVCGINRTVDCETILKNEAVEYGANVVVVTSKETPGGADQGLVRMSAIAYRKKK